LLLLLLFELLLLLLLLLLPLFNIGGKARVLEELQARHAYHTIVMIGDGITDLQARPPVRK
jgi:hypothetical protein